MRSPAMLSSAAFLLSVVSVSFWGCSFGQSGIDPPSNRISLPAGVVADPDDDFLYVVNSNSDLRFNAGTLVAVDLAKAALTRAQARQDGNAWPICPKTRFSRTEPVPDDYCCRDLIDTNIINCNEPQYIQADATVRLGSFGGAVELQRYQRGAEFVRRLFVAVRAEPSITFADVTVNAGRVSIRCTGPQQDGSPQPANAYCEDNWRVRRPGGVTPGAEALPEEPHLLSLDSTRGILFVGHLTVFANAQVQGGGVSTLDICNPQTEDSVRFAGLARTVFPPAANSQAVAALSPGDSANPSSLLYATARYSTGISGLVLRDTNQSACAPERDLTLVPGEHFASPAFLPNGTDVRGILFSTDHSQSPQAFVLHRNDSDTTANPAAIVVLDRQLLADGSTPSNSPVDIIEVCNGPTDMQMYPPTGPDARIYVTCYDDGQIYVIDPLALVVTSVIDVGAGPTSLVFPKRDAGVAYVANFANSHLSVIDLAPGSPTRNRVVQRIGLPHGYGE